MEIKERYNIMLKPSVVKAIERQGTTRSGVVEKILERHISNSNATDMKPDAKGKRVMNKLLSLSQRITENKHSIEFWESKAKDRDKLVEDMPGIINRLVAETVKKAYENIGFAINPMKTDIKSLTERIKIIEDDKREERLKLKSTPVGYLVFNQLSHKVDSLERQFKTHRGLLKEEAESMKWIPQEYKMWLEGVSSEEAIRINEERAAKIEKWLKNKSVKSRKRVLYRLYKYGGPMSTVDVAFDIKGNASAVYRTLQHMKIDSYVKAIRKNNKLKWMISPRGEKEVERAQKNGIIPSFRDNPSR